MKSLLAYILGSALVGFALATMECLEDFNDDRLKELEDSLNDPDVDELAVLCPLVSNYFSCLEEMVGMSLSTFALIAPNDDIRRAVNVLSNVRDTFKDLCEEGNILNTEYKKHSVCYKKIETSDAEDCKEEAVTAYHAYLQFQNKVETEIGPSGIVDSRACLQAAYLVACVAEKVHQECGSEATDLFNTLIKRTTVFRNGFCSPEDLLEIKTGFLESLNLEGSKRDIFQKAFDLRRRRK